MKMFKFKFSRNGSGKYNFYIKELDTYEASEILQVLKLLRSRRIFDQKDPITYPVKKNILQEKSK